MRRIYCTIWVICHHKEKVSTTHSAEYNSESFSCFPNKSFQVWSIWTNKKLEKKQTKIRQTSKQLAQHTTPIAKTHRTATLFSSEPTENLKVHQYSSPKHHNIITITAASPPTTETPQHHRHRAETSPTQNQGITHISPKHHNAITTHHRDTPETSPTHQLKITRTLLAHAEDILTHHQRITETSPRYHWIIHETQTKHNRDITETSPKHHQDITET